MVDMHTLFIPRHDGRGTNCYGKTGIITGHAAVVFSN